MRLPTYETQNLFLLIAAILSALANEQKSNIWHSSILLQKYETFEIIVRTLLTQIGEYDVQGSLEYFIELLPKYELQFDNLKLHLEFQVQLFHTKSGNFIRSFPDEYKPELRQIYLATDSYDGEKQIYFIIPKLKKFFNIFGIHCFFCHKFFTSRGCIHKCSQIPNCFSCHRPYLQQNTYVTCETADNFCDGLLTPSPALKCKKCNVTYFSSNCYKKHCTKVCQHGWKCPTCKIFQSCNTFYKSQNDIKTKHICFQRTCNYCGKHKETPHFCTLKQVDDKREFTNLGFVTFEYAGYNVGKCKVCFVSQNPPCANCLNEQEHPVCAAILQEEQNRNSFSLKILYDNTFKIEEVQEKETFLKKAFEFCYIPSFVEKYPKLAPEGRKTHFGQRQKKSNKYVNAFKGPCMTFMQIFFDYLMRNKFSNSTILVFSGTNRDMFYILQGLLQNGFSPKVIKRHNQIMLIEDTNLGLRFVEIQNYVNCSFKELCTRISAKEPFFPLSWIQPKFYTYNGKPPSLDDYFHFEDSKDDLKEKTNFVHSMGNKWNFKLELAQYISKKVKILAHVFLDFIRETFYCQQILMSHMQERNVNNSTKTYLHPLNNPIFTAATYTFQLFLKYCQESDKITTVNNPIPFKSSKGEIEYMEYVKWQNPNIKVEYAWSSKGQRDLYYSKPDGYCENIATLWYYHGCFFHSHAPEKCFFKRKSNTLAEEKEITFKKKLWLIKENHKIENVVVMWECVWRFFKKNNANVRYFMDNIYQNPPMHRLDARNAGIVHR